MSWFKGFAEALALNGRDGREWSRNGTIRTIRMEWSSGPRSIRARPPDHPIANFYHPSFTANHPDHYPGASDKGAPAAMRVGLLVVGRPIVKAIAHRPAHMPHVGSRKKNRSRYRGSNVRNCCADWYGEGYYLSSPTDDSSGPTATPEQQSSPTSR